ncbi:MAG: hypothetical protein AAF726_16200 [Planctomycetota bacterium]
MNHALPLVAASLLSGGAGDPSLLQEAEGLFDSVTSVWDVLDVATYELGEASLTGIAFEGHESAEFLPPSIRDGRWLEHAGLTGIAVHGVTGSIDWSGDRVVHRVELDLRYRVEDDRMAPLTGDLIGLLLATDPRSSVEVQPAPQFDEEASNWRLNGLTVSRESGPSPAVERRSSAIDESSVTTFFREIAQRLRIGPDDFSVETLEGADVEVRLPIRGAAQLQTFVEVTQRGTKSLRLESFRVELDEGPMWKAALRFAPLERQ